MTHLNYGLFLAIGAGIIFQSFFMRKSYLFILNILLFGSITSTQFINIGRSGYILYIISILLILTLQYKQLIIKKTHILIGLIALVLYLAYSLSPNFKSRIDLTMHTFEQIYTDSNYNNSIGIRIQNYKYAFDLIAEKPFLGYGIGQNVKVLSESMKTDEATIAKIISNHSTTDSQYLDILLQFGVIGFMIFINIFFQLVRYQYQDEYQKRVAILFVTLFLIYAIQANFMHFYNATSLLLIFFSSILASKR
jgi:O-antigen ligase